MKYMKKNSRAYNEVICRPIFVPAIHNRDNLFIYQYKKKRELKKKVTTML